MYILRGRHRVGQTSTTINAACHRVLQFTFQEDEIYYQNRSNTFSNCSMHMILNLGYAKLNPPLVTPALCRQRTIHVEETLQKVQQEKKTGSNRAPKDDAISSLLVPNFAHQAVDPRYLTGSSNYSSVDTCQSFPLQAKVLVDSICLTENSVGHVVTVVYPAALIQHILCFCGLGVL